MMEPASSSDDDSFSSSSGREPLHGRDPGPEPVDSDDDNSSGEDDDGDGEYGASHSHHQVSNFDDLPTDDSDDESDSDSDGSSIEDRRRAGGINDDEDNSGDDGINPEDVPLSERVSSRAQIGRRYYTGEDQSNEQDKHSFGAFDDSGKKERAVRKSRAIELASERLREALKKEKGANKGMKQSTGDYSSDDDDDSSIEQASSANNNKDTKKKKSKHAPTEMSSKRRDFFARGRPDLNSSGIGVSIGANKYKSRDPRMISLSGHLDADVFEKRYGFLDEVQEKEIEQLKKRVAAWKKSGKKGQKERKKLGMTQAQGGGSLEDDKEELTRLLQELAERKKANVVRAAKRSVKQKLRDDVASGKRGAYYPKRSELRRMEGEAKFEEIRKRGGDDAVNRAIEKRRKKNMSKSAKSMPSHKVS